jgi:hypothetical protein
MTAFQKREGPDDEARTRGGCQNAGHRKAYDPWFAMSLKKPSSGFKTTGDPCALLYSIKSRDTLIQDVPKYITLYSHNSERSSPTTLVVTLVTDFCGRTRWRLAVQESPSSVTIEHKHSGLYGSLRSILGLPRTFYSNDVRQKTVNVRHGDRLLVGAVAYTLEITRTTVLFEEPRQGILQIVIDPSGKRTR